MNATGCREYASRNRRSEMSRERVLWGKDNLPLTATMSLPLARRLAVPRTSATSRAALRLRGQKPAIFNVLAAHRQFSTSPDPRRDVKNHTPEPLYSACLFFALFLRLLARPPYASFNISIFYCHVWDEVLNDARIRTGRGCLEVHANKVVPASVVRRRVPTSVPSVSTQFQSK